MFVILDQFRKHCTVCIVANTFILSQINSGHSFTASKIINRLPREYIPFNKKGIKTFKQKYAFLILTVICKHLSIYRQEDAHEFLRYLIESMGRCYMSALDNGAELYVFPQYYKFITIREKKKINITTLPIRFFLLFSLDNYSRETTPINQIFGGYIRSEGTYPHLF